MIVASVLVLITVLVIVLIAVLRILVFVLILILIVHDKFLQKCAGLCRLASLCFFS